MRVRAIKDLTQLGEQEFFNAIAEGLDLIVKHITRIYAGATTLDEAGQTHASRVLSMIAEEEAAKFLILIDAVRCPRKPESRLAGQLGRFNQHLAKGLYARACMWCPVTLGQLQEYVNNDREDFYLDGPNDVDWIYRNQVIQNREGALYVDYVAHDDKHRWHDPLEFEELHFSGRPEPWSVTTTKHLHGVGVSTAAALAAVAELWRASPPAPNTHCSEIWRMNQRTLELMDKHGLLKEQPASTYAWLIRQWQFPMYDLDLSEIKVPLETLREQQRNWGQDFY